MICQVEWTVCGKRDIWVRSINSKRCAKKCEIIKVLLKAAVIWEGQQSHAYVYAGVFGFFAYV